MKIASENNVSIRDFKVLYNTYYASLCMFSNRYLNDMDLSKDVVQEVFLKVWQKQIVFENENAIKSYLYTSVKNKCLDFIKSKSFKMRQNLNIEDKEVLESQTYFEKELFLEEVNRTVAMAVNMLPNKCREIISLSLKGLKNNQISEELSISLNTVKTQKRIAYQKLRPILQVFFSSLMLFLFNN